MPDTFTKTDSDVEAFIASIDNPGRREDAAVILKMMTRVSGYAPKMWGSSMIGFGQYHYKYESGHEGDAFRTGFSPRKANMVIYIMPGYDDYSEELSRLGPYKKGKSCLYLGRLGKIDIDVLEDIVAKGLTVMAQRYPDDV